MPYISFNTHTPTKWPAGSPYNSGPARGYRRSIITDAARHARMFSLDFRRKTRASLRVESTAVPLLRAFAPARHCQVKARQPIFSTIRQLAAHQPAHDHVAATRQQFTELPPLCHAIFLASRAPRGRSRRDDNAASWLSSAQSRDSFSRTCRQRSIRTRGKLQHTPPVMVFHMILRFTGLFGLRC